MSPLAYLLQCYYKNLHLSHSTLVLSMLNAISLGPISLSKPPCLASPTIYLFLLSPKHLYLYTTTLHLVTYPWRHTGRWRSLPPPQCGRVGCSRTWGRGSAWPWSEGWGQGCDGVLKVDREQVRLYLDKQVVVEVGNKVRIHKEERGQVLHRFW